MKPLNVLTKHFMSLTGLKYKIAKIHLNVINYFLKKFLSIYKNFFSRKKIKPKVKSIQSPWITSGIKRSSKRKQHLYEKFLKTRSQKSELEYKNYKNLFKTIKKRSKKLHYSKLIIKYKENIKNMVSN